MGGAGVHKQDKDNEEIRQHLQKIREEHAKKLKVDYSHVFRKKSRLDMIRLSSIVMGIEFCYAALTSFGSPILLEIGIKHQQMTMVWGLSPIIGFFLAPLVGSLSDQCRLKLGRRRPFILILSFAVIIGLLLVPYGQDIGLLLGDVEPEPQTTYEFISHHLTIINYTGDPFDEGYKDDHIPEIPTNTKVWAIVFTILGIMLIDFNANICITPSRAYLLDVTVSDDHPKCLSTFTIMAGLGGCLGYTLGGIDWNQLKIGDALGGNIKTVFIIVLVIFVICFVVTTTSFREIPLPEMEKDELLKPITGNDVKKELERPQTPSVDDGFQFELAEKLDNYPLPLGSAFATLDPNTEKAENKAPPAESEEEHVTLAQYLKTVIFMPKSMRILCLTNLFCWMSCICYVLYFTAFVGEDVFNGAAEADADSDEYKRFSEGVRFGCWGLALYALSCSFYSYGIEYLIKFFGIKRVYIVGLIIFGIGMIVLGSFPNKVTVLVCSCIAGIIYTTIFTIPFVLVVQYHENDTFKVKKGVKIVSTKKRGLGTDIAVVNSMIFVAQILISLSAGLFISWIGSISAVIYAAGFFGFCGAVGAMFVLYI